MSNRLTFSLASLIFLIAFGLVFAPVSVMAHPVSDTTIGPHTEHPVLKEVVADENAVPPILPIPLHGKHPVPTITLLEVKDKAKGSEVIITSATDGTTNVFSVVIGFQDALTDGDAIAVSGQNDSTAASANFSIPANRFRVLLLDKNGDPVASNASIAPAQRFDADGTAEANDPIHAVVTIPTASVPTGTGKMESLTIRLQLKQGAANNETDNRIAFGLQKTVVQGAQTLTVPGGYNLESAVAEFRLVKAFDETGPRVTAVTADTTTPNKFSIAFDEALKSGSFTADDLVIVGGTANLAKDDEPAAGFPTGVRESWTLTVTPDDSYELVTVQVKADSVEDAFGSTGPAAAFPSTPVASLDKIGPAVNFAVSSPDKPPKLNKGKAEFTITFSEQLGPDNDGLQYHDLAIKGGKAVEADITGPKDATDDSQEDDVYTLAVTPDIAYADIVPGGGYPAPADIEVMFDTDSLGPQIEDAVGNSIDLETPARYGSGASATFKGTKSAIFDRTPPLGTVTAPASQPPLAGRKLVFRAVFTEAVTVSVFDRGDTANLEIQTGDGVTEVADPISGIKDGKTYDIQVTVKDPNKPTTLLFPAASVGSVKDLAGHALAADASATYTPDLPNKPPAFYAHLEKKMDDRIKLLSNGLQKPKPWDLDHGYGLCVKDGLPKISELEKRLELPLAYDPDPGSVLTYTLTHNGTEVSRTDKATGFYYQNIDGQPRLLLAKSAVIADHGTYVWTVSDGRASDTYTFDINVEKQKKANTPSGLEAAKVDSAALTTINHQNRVRLTWSDPDPTKSESKYPICRPANLFYELYITLWDANIDEWVTPSRFATPVKIDGPVTTYTTVELANGIYRFQLTTNNGIDGDTGKSAFAVWTKNSNGIGGTGGTQVIVAHPPKAPINTASPVKVNGNTVTLNWLAVPERDQNGAPVYDDLVSADHPDHAKLDRTRTTYYGKDSDDNPVMGDFGGYVVYQIDAVTQQVVARYPSVAKPNSDRMPSNTVKLLPLSGQDHEYYDHPSFTTPPLNPGRYAFRFTAVNIAGESERSLTTPIVTIDEEPTPGPNTAPTFGQQTVKNITATVDTAIESVTLPKGTDADAADTLTHTLTPAVPAGLKYVQSTRFLHGTPTAAMKATTYTYTVSDGKSSESLNFTIEVKAKPTEPVDPDPVATYDPATKKTTINKGTIAANGFFVVYASALPDLELFFSAGGTITLMDPDSGTTAAKTVVISEILWGLDFGETRDQQKNKQFIELYNTNIPNSGDVDLAGWKLVFQEGRPAPANDVDQVSNVAGTGWVVDVGQSGRVAGTTLFGGTVAPTELISMYRKINYAKVQNTDGGDVAKRLEGVPGGNAKGGWAASTRVTTQTSIKSSPGRRPFVPVSVITATAVPRSPFVINEIGNGTGGTHDWVEIRNVTDSEQSLKNYQLSVVTSDKKEAQLFHFHDKDYKVPAKGVILVASTSPENTDIAAGVDVARSANDQELTGVDTLYVVRSFNLPDSGKTLLILRNNHETKHLTTDAHIVDVVGTLKIEDTARATSLWPLKATGGPHGNVIDGTDDEDFRAGKVYQRNDAGGGTLEKDLAVRGYTGIGYDRVAANSAVNGGTPGYDNGAHKEYNDANVTKSAAPVTVSEIMLEVGSGRQSTPQWIELYNSSMTSGVKLDGWKLSIENANDVDTALNATITLGAYTIAPNQTVLIVTTSGRMSDADHFPGTRVINLWTTKAHRDALQMKNRNVQVFSATGFYFELVDKAGKLVDEGGNLDGSRRTRDEPAWALPMGKDDDRRSSFIRVYDRGTASDGTMAAGWISADTTNLAYAISDTYYGDPDDFGTPGFRGGGPLPVSLSKFRPERLENGSIVVRWITESELNNAGFNILRSETKDGEYTKLNTKLIAGQGTTSEKTTYEYPDTSAKPNVVYYYQIQDVSLDGKVTTLRVNRLKGHISAAGKATTTWGELKALQ